MSDVEITKPGGIAAGVAAAALGPSAVAGAADAASVGAVTMLPQERRMMILSLAGYFLSPKATRLLVVMATLSTMSVVVSLAVAGGVESKE